MLRREFLSRLSGAPVVGAVIAALAPAKAAAKARRFDEWKHVNYAPTPAYDQMSQDVLIAANSWYAVPHEYIAEPQIRRDLTLAYSTRPYLYPIL